MLHGQLSQDIGGESEPLAIVYCRVSTPDQADSGTSLDTQEAACLALCKQRGIAVPVDAVILEDHTGAVLDRPGLRQVFDLCRTRRFCYLVVFVLDRIFRPETEADAWRIFPVLQELKEAGLEVIWVHGGPPTSGPFASVITFLDSWRSGQEREAIRERTMRGKRRTAELGRVPSGFGRYGGPYGTRWDKAKKQLVWLSESHRSLVRRVLDSCLGGMSINSILVGLNDALKNDHGLPAAAGGYWHRSSVHRVLTHARLYAGTATWDGIDIPCALERPVCAESEAAAISRRLARNKELGKGYGRRRWLTGRVFGECGRTYSLAAKQGCRCRGDSRLLPIRCGDVGIRLKRLEATVFRALHEVLYDPERLRVALIHARAEWELKAYQVEEQRDAIRQQLEQLGARRRLLSVQHEHRVINDTELFARFRNLEGEESRAKDALEDLKTLTSAQVDSAPPLTAWLDDTVPQLLEKMALDMAHLERGAREDEATSRQPLDRIAEEMGLRVTVRQNGALAVQFRIPAHLVPPGSRDEAMFEEEEAAMLSPTSS